MQAQFKKRALVLGVSASAIAALVACGGGGGSESGASLSPSQVQGKAVDFYLSQANVVFTDCNNQTTTTDNEGNFTIPSFFKQKTAYEMQHCDWSSDVSLPICAS